MDEISLNGITIHLVGSSKISSLEDCCVYSITDDQDLSILIDAETGSKHSIKNITNNICQIQPINQIEYILVSILTLI